MKTEKEINPQPSAPESEVLKNTECTLTDEQLIEKCFSLISKLCETGGRSWTLHIPVRLNEDPDVIFATVAQRLRDANRSRSLAEKELEEAKELLVDIEFEIIEDHYGPLKDKIKKFLSRNKKGAEG